MTKRVLVFTALVLHLTLGARDDIYSEINRDQSAESDAGGGNDDVALAGDSTCAPGTTAHGNACTPCEPGRWNSDGLRCHECSAGYYGLGGSQSARCSGACPAGRFGVGGSRDANCSGPCPRGRWGRSAATQRGCSGPCLAGRYGVGGSTSAACDGACPLGRYAPAGSDACRTVMHGAAAVPPMQVQMRSPSWTANDDSKTATSPEPLRVDRIDLRLRLRRPHNSQPRHTDAGGKLRRAVAHALSQPLDAVSVVSVNAHESGATPTGHAPGAGTEARLSIVAQPKAAMQIDAELLAPGFRGLLCRYLNAEHLFESRLVAADVHVGAPHLSTGIIRATRSHLDGSASTKISPFTTSARASASTSASGAGAIWTPQLNTQTHTTMSRQSVHSANVLLMGVFGVLLLVATRVSVVESAPTTSGPWFGRSGYGSYAGSYGHGGYGAVQRGQFNNFAHGGLGAAWECGFEHMQIQSAHGATQEMELGSIPGAMTTGTGTNVNTGCNTAASANGTLFPPSMPHLHAQTGADIGTPFHHPQSRQNANAEQETSNNLD